jgi:hypothetical protein
MSVYEWIGIVIGVVWFAVIGAAALWAGATERRPRTSSAA